MQDGHKSSVDAKNHEENNVQAATGSIPLPEEASNGLWSCQQLKGKKKKGRYFKGKAFQSRRALFHVRFMLNQNP